MIYWQDPSPEVEGFQLQADEHQPNNFATGILVTLAIDAVEPKYLYSK